MDWKIAALITMLALGVYNILVREFVKKVDWRIVVPIAFVASLILLIYFFATYSSFIGTVTTDSILLSLALAFVFGISTVFTYITFAEGAQPGHAAILFNLSALVTLLISVFFLKIETIDLQAGIGILFSLLGMLLILYK